MASSAQTVMTNYFNAWRAKDFSALKALLAPNVDFLGPLGQEADAETYTRGIEGMSQVVTDIVVHRMFVQDAEVITWFDLHTSVAAAPLPVANWSQVHNGQIHRVRVAFDPRPLTASAPPPR
jgi:hypothetical protein